MTYAIINLIFAFFVSDTLSLSQMHALAEQNWPSYSQLERSEQISDLRIESLRQTWLPDVFMNVSAQYHSEVTNIPFSAPGVTPPSQPHDRYSAVMEVQQTLWDGGMSKKRTDLEKRSQKVNEQKVAVDLYALKEQVNETFFSIVLLEQRLNSLEIIINELHERQNLLEARVEAGLILSTQLDILKLETLKSRQSISELRHLKLSAFDVLEILTGTELSGDETLILDDIEIDQMRPELSLFDAQIESMRASMELTKVNLMPKLSAFGQGGIGRPGPDIFNDSFRPYFVVGVQGRWQLWDWRKSNRDRQEIQLGIRTIEDSRKSFIRIQSIQIAKQLARIESIEEQLAMDDEIIALRESVVKSTSSQLENGVITATEFLIELNASHLSRLQRKIREIELFKAQTALKTINISVE
jgi:outer membrane protein TolC